MGTPQYDRENTRRINLKLNKKTDADIIQHLEAIKSNEGIQGYIKALIRADIEKEEPKMKIQFMGGQSKRGDHAVNLMISEDRELYAEVKLPEDVSDDSDYGYLALKAEIIRQAEEQGITGLEFWYDGQENLLSKDASVECNVEA